MMAQLRLLAEGLVYLPIETLLQLEDLYILLKPIEQPITLNHPKFPASTSYSITKTANEDFIEISGLDYVTFRLANVIGPRNVAGPLPIFYQRLKDNPFESS